MARHRLLLPGLVGLALVGAAGLVFAQNEVSNTVAPAPPTPPAPPSANIAPPLAPALVPPPEPAPPTANSDDQDDASDRTPAANVAAGPPPPPPPPPKRPRYALAVLQTLDKVTAETLRFEAKVDEPVRYKDLVITVHACETSAADETFPETAAHLDVQYQPDLLPGAKGATARRIYQGWMFANAPGLHPLQHPIYDLWLIACRTPSPAPPKPAGASL